MDRAFELVSLDEYRHACAILRARKRITRWNALRFKDLDLWKWYVLPNGCGGSGYMYYKVDDDGAQCWKFNHEKADAKIFFTQFAALPILSVPHDIPVIKLGLVL